MPTQQRALRRSIRDVSNRSSSEHRQIIPFAHLSLPTNSGVWRLADWARSPENLAYHVETLVSWAPVELLEKPSAVTDEAGHLWYLCKFRYFGPVRERETLILSVRSALDNLTSWRDVEEHR